MGTLPLLLALAATSSTSVLTLEQALDIASKQQPRLQISAADVRISHAQSEQASSGYYPRVDLFGQYQRSTANFIVTPIFSKSAFASALVPGTSWDTVNVYQFGANATMTLYDFGRTGGAVD